ncbi:Protein SABRE [Rhizina undulata]
MGQVKAGGGGGGFSLPTFALGIVVLLYLSTFIIFAVLRVLTGLSIQRVGYLSLKRISFAPKDGIKLEVRKLGLLLHRPTFAQPTWISIVIQDSHVTVDLKRLEAAEEDEKGKKAKGKGKEKPNVEANGNANANAETLKEAKGKALKKMEKIWEKMAKADKWMKYVQMVDVVVTNMNLTVVEVGTVQIGSMTVMVDTRRKNDRDLRFDHCNALKGNQNPVELMFTTRSVLFFTEKKEPTEIMDHLVFNIYGVLEKDVQGIMDAAVAIKFGRISIPCDEILACVEKFKRLKKPGAKQSRTPTVKEPGASLGTLMEEIAVLPAESRTKRISEAVKESQELLQSFLNGFKEIQFAIGYLLVSKSVATVQPTGKPLRVIIGMKELGMDLHRLDQKSPAHRMYFSSDDIAHQALLAAISISVSLDDGVRQDKVLYVPMVTMTSKTTLPSKILQLADQSESDRNTNILIANIVVTSPSIDLEPRHLPLLLAMAKSNKSKNKSTSSRRRTGFMSNLLPKASVKFSIHEPVVRIVLPPSDPEKKDSGDTDMLISSLSSISADLESSHETEGNEHYALTFTFRVASHNLCYRAAVSGEKHDLFSTDSFDLKAQLVASPEVHVQAQAYLETFVIRLVRPEIVQGLKQMAGQFHANGKPNRPSRPKSNDSSNFLRKIPAWLDTFKLEGRDFSVEVAGVDPDISQFTRGAAVQFESWSIEYKCRKSDGTMKHPPRRRATSRTMSTDEYRLPRRPALLKNPTDGRKLSIHVRGLEGFMVDSADTWEEDPFLNLPNFDVAFTTTTDGEGQILHIASQIKSILFNYSLFRHYAVIVAVKVLKEAFGNTGRKESEGAPASYQVLHARGFSDMDFTESPICDVKEFVSIDLKVQHVRVKARFPNDPPMMLEMFALDTGRHRWGFPFFKAQLIRLYADSPTVKGCWARLATLRLVRVDLREGRKKTSGHFEIEKSIDVSADAIRLAIPHQLILYQITDNIVNSAKAAEQMLHRLKTGSNEYIVERKAVGPKRVSKLSLRTRALLLELEDDPFETQLGLIYRIGLSEQKKRLARETAFEAKAQKMRELAQEEEPSRGSFETSRTGLKLESSAASRFRGRSKTWNIMGSAPLESPRTTESPEVKRERLSKNRRSMRYDPESAAEPSENASVSIEEARQKLNEHNSSAWIKRIRWAQEQYSQKSKEERESFWGLDEIPIDVEGAEAENILGLPARAALMTAMINDVEIVVDKPSFALEELPKFLHKVGKGLPEDTKFALLVPLSLKVEFSEARMLLRDYPLPFVHIPAMRPSQAGRLAAFSLTADLVIGEELRGPESMKHVVVRIEPPPTGPEPGAGGFAIDVRRTVSPVKSYSDFKVAINTSDATKVTWCTSYQPAIQDMMMVFETITKPHLDPSEKVGFWDKIRMVLHSQISIGWKGDGDVHLTLKGSRDPYELTGDGAGFVLCWRGDVNWQIGREPDDPKQFMTVDSEEFLMAVPDFTHHARDNFESPLSSETKSILGMNSFENGMVFKKIIMKLAGKVRLLVGLMFEQEISHEEDWKQRKRSFEFRPHYDITLKTPQHCIAPPGETYDAFRGFRSHHLHLSLSIISPVDRDWSQPIMGDQPPTSYNTIHLSPKFFTHFFSWLRLFSGAMSLPIRQGALWPGPEKSSKKFGRHLATIKYKLCLSPLFISHIYKHNDKDEAGNDVIAATGLKAKLDSFMVDMHQRREETMPNGQSTGMRLNQAEIDFHSADIRAVSAVISESTIEELMKQADEAPMMAEGVIRYSGDMSQFTIPDGDYSWVDMDDFAELDWALPTNKTPKTLIMPLAFAPRLTYFRQTDHGEGNSFSSPFGHEPTHDCVMSQNNDPREIQCGLVQARLEKVNEQMQKNKEALSDLALEIKLNPDDLNLKSESEKLIQQSSILFNKLDFLQSMLRRMSSKLDDASSAISADDSDSDSELPAMDTSPFQDYISDFDNRFIVHNMQAKWNNTLRNIILKYIHQVGQRRGFVYYLSRRAVKFIEDIVAEQQRASGKQADSSHGEKSSSRPSSSSPEEQNEDEVTLESRIQDLLNDDVKFVVADESEKRTHSRSFSATGGAKADDLVGDVAEDYVPQNSYHIRLIAPQIQMQSEKNRGAAVLVVAQGMQLKVVSIMDRERIGDEVSGLVQQRFALHLENTQFFVTQNQDFASESMALHSANRYGAPAGSSWPPWVPLESMFDFRNNPVGFSRVIERTSATLRYDKHNSLRLKYSDQVSGDSDTSSVKGGPPETEKRIDQVWIDFPKVEISCDSAQYFAMYIIVLDVLLYSEPLEKLRSEKLEKIMLASDFSNLEGAAQVVERLQSRIHQLEEIKTYFEINARSLDREGWKSRTAVDLDLTNCEEELFFMMKAITTSQRKYEDRSSQASGGILRWYFFAMEITWHLLREKMDPLVDIRLSNAGYERMDNADGSNFNTVEVEMMRGFNLLPEAVYPEMIAPFFDSTRTVPEIHQTKILRVYWHMLEAIAGIPVMDHFEVNLFPLKIQLEREIGDKLFDYIFPGIGTGEEEESNGNGFSPFLAQSMKPLADESEDEYSDDDMISRRDYTRVLDDSESIKSSISASPKNDPKLKPAFTFSAFTSSNDQRPTSSSSDKARPTTSKSMTPSNGFRGAFKPNKTLTSKASSETLSVKPRKSSDVGITPSIMGDKKRLALFHRSNASEQIERDEVSQMMSRASNYMTLAYIKIPSVVLCLSYKGRGDTNLEDIHELVFRMPMLEYRNKTWSNLDLAMRLKKDIIRALIGHTGAILQNKLTHHRPVNKTPTNILRMMANNNALGTSGGFGYSDSDVMSIRSEFSMSPSDSTTIVRPSTGYLKPPTRTGTSFSSSSLAGSLNLATPDLSVTTEDDEDKDKGFFNNTLGRHLSNLATVARNRDGIADDSEESVRKKGRMLLGKKVFGGP